MSLFRKSHALSLVSHFPRVVQSGVIATLTLLLAGPARAAEPVMESFEKDIQPVLDQYCYD